MSHALFRSERREGHERPLAAAAPCHDAGVRSANARSEIGWLWVVVWAAFAVYAFAFAPPDDPALTKALLRGMFTTDFGAADPAIAAVFSTLGVVPVLASTFVLADGARRRLAAWPFALGMFAVGAFALLPWLAFRGLGGPRASPREPGAVARFLGKRFCRAGIVLALLGLSGWGLARGSAAAYAAAFRSASMVNVMTLDLLLCTLLLYVLVEEARQREPTVETRLARGLRFIPLFGGAFWNFARSPESPFRRSRRSERT